MSLLLTVGLWATSLLRGEYLSSPGTSLPAVPDSTPAELDQSVQCPINYQDAFPSRPVDPSRLSNWISGAVQHDTTVYDEWGPLNDASSDEIKQSYADKFKPFESWLEVAFPKVHSRLEKEVVHSHGLLFTWKGADESQKPLLLMAHQDVVPVEPSTVSTWVHPPFSGYIDQDNQVVWGRGSSDDKSGLIGILSSLEVLIESNPEYQPKRSVLASFGFDEESFGFAAENLANFILYRYGPDGIEMIVDEGDSVVSKGDPDNLFGIDYAGVATSEKGYSDIKVVVNTPGGHSSRPPTKTGIGYLSRILTSLEDNPPQASLDSIHHPALAKYLALADTPGLLQRRPKLVHALQRIIRKPRDKKLLSNVLNQLSEDELFEFKTTQAIDMIEGGIKVNALPEHSVATVNYRIDVTSSVSELKSHVEAIVEKRTKELGLQYNGWNSNPASLTSSSLSKGSVHLEIVGPLEPAPHTPTMGADAQAWHQLAFVIQSTWNHSIPVLPTLMGGNTDTKSYWKLSKNIFRFSGGSLKPLSKELEAVDGGIHTVNEFVQIDALERNWKFYTKLILAV